MNRISCPHCAKRLTYPDERAGRTAKCPACGQSFVLAGESVRGRRSESSLPPPAAVQDPTKSANLFPCPDCGKQVSRKAYACPECGCPLEEDRPNVPSAAPNPPPNPPVIVMPPAATAIPPAPPVQQTSAVGEGFGKGFGLVFGVIAAFIVLALCCAGLGDSSKSSAPPSGQFGK
jgi:hypothetical protein